MSASLFDPSGGNLTNIVTALQGLVRAIYLIQETLSGGVAITNSLPGYTVAGLPATAPLGQMAYATNGRANGGEGAGAGTGCLVVGNGTIWRAAWSGALVLA